MATPFQKVCKKGMSRDGHFKSLIQQEIIPLQSTEAYNVNPVEQLCLTARTHNFEVLLWLAKQVPTYISYISDKGLLLVTLQFAFNFRY